MLTQPEIDVTPGLRWAERVVGTVTAVRELAGGWTSTMLALTGEGGAEAVLRLMTREPWRTHGAGLTSRECEVQRMLADTTVPAPRRLALDAEGRHCGFLAHLMTLLPGRTDVDRTGPGTTAGLVGLLASIHDVVPTIEVRDFQPRNVLWSGGRISGVVDWVETSIGPAWLDVAHCATNVAIVHGAEAAGAFAAAYTERTGREAAPYFDVMDVVGFLPPPGKQGFFADDGPENHRLEERLLSLLRRPGT